MKKYSKRIRNLRTFITEEVYSFEQAVSLLKKVGNAKFIESVMIVLKFLIRFEYFFIVIPLN